MHGFCVAPCRRQIAGFRGRLTVTRAFQPMHHLAFGTFVEQPQPQARPVHGLDARDVDSTGTELFQHRARVVGADPTEDPDFQSAATSRQSHVNHGAARLPHAGGAVGVNQIVDHQVADHHQVQPLAPARCLAHVCSKARTRASAL